MSDPGEARTLDPLIKSQLLYQLSYGVIVVGNAPLDIAIGVFLNCDAKVGLFFDMTKFFRRFL